MGQSDISEEGICPLNAPEGALFIRRVGRAEELASSLAALGWSCRVGLAPEGPGPGPGAGAVLIDLRGGATVPEASDGRPVLALVDDHDRATLAAARSAGATHVLADADPAAVSEALRFAADVLRVTDPPLRRLDDAAEPGEATARLEAWGDAAIAEGRGIVAVRASLIRFDIVNAAFGRSAGDRALDGVATRVAAAADRLFGTRAIHVRLDGTEFAVVGESALADANRAAAEVARVLGQRFEAAEVGARVGAAASRPGEDAATVLRAAGQAMDRAGEGGWAARPGRPGPDHGDRLAVDLRHAIRGDELAVLFQPQCRLMCGNVVGVEALARWRHPVHGEVGAETLFAAAGVAGLGAFVSDRVQDLALRTAAGWTGAASGLRLSINLTADDLGRPDFARDFLHRVGLSGFPPERLTVEVTEGGLIGDRTAAAAVLGTLRVAGCRTAVDDFGTGYSSLAYLQALPLNYLKLDKAFLRPDAGSRAVVRGILAMARAMNLTTIAEGVETEEQRAALVEEGCELYQGFLCSEPLEAAALTRMMEVAHAD